MTIKNLSATEKLAQENFDDLARTIEGLRFQPWRDGEEVAAVEKEYLPTLDAALELAVTPLMAKLGCYAVERDSRKDDPRWWEALRWWESLRVWHHRAAGRTAP